MEQFILGMLQEQLGKYIVGFRKEMVNASLLNGKGEITDLSLNCSAINQQLSNVMPFIEIESLHISRVGFQVTSWTNLRKSPIMVDIEHITVHLAEPLHYLYPKKRRRIKQMTVSEMNDHFQEMAAQAKANKTSFHNPNQRGGYSIADRILDNLRIDIKSIYVQFQTWGKFKTRRPGPWTPPTLQFVLRNLKYVSVDEFGEEGTPDEVWAHNHRPTPKGQERTLLIFKRFSFDFDFGLETNDGQQISLLRGGKGIQAPLSPKIKENAESSKLDSLTAEETLAALAATTGPMSVSVSAERAKETVAALVATTGGSIDPTNSRPSSMPSIPSNKFTDSAPSSSKSLGSATQQQAPQTLNHRFSATTTDEMDTSSPPGMGEGSKIEDEVPGYSRGDACNTTDRPDGTENSSTTSSSTKPSGTITASTNNTGSKDNDKVGPTTSDTRDQAKDTEAKRSSSGEEKRKEDLEAEKSASANEKKDEEGLAKASDTSEPSSADEHNNKIAVQIAMKRRLRDGALLAIQIDSTLNKVEILIPSEVVPHLLQVALGLQYCFCKDRGFEDPLRHKDDHTDHNDSKAILQSQPAEGDGTNNEDDCCKKGLKDGKTSVMGSNDSQQQMATANSTLTAADADNFVCEQQHDVAKVVSSGDSTIVKLKDVGASDDASSNQPAALTSILSESDLNGMSLGGETLSVMEETTVESITENEVYQQQTETKQPVAEGNRFSKSISSLFSRRSPTPTTTPDREKEIYVPRTPPGEKLPPPQPSIASCKVDSDRAIIMLPNGLVIHEKISFSVSVDRITIRGIYPALAKTTSTPSPHLSTGLEKKDDKSNSMRTEGVGAALPPKRTKELEYNDYIQVDSNGAVMELIWPKEDLKKGGTAQVSVSHVSIQERYGKRIQTLVKGGVRHDPLSRPVEKQSEGPKEVSTKECFPIYVDRAIRKDPIDMRDTYPVQAVGLVATIECQTRETSSPESQYRASEEMPLPTTITTTKNTSVEATTETNESMKRQEVSSAVKRYEGSESRIDNVEHALMVTNDMGVDKFKVVLDCESWCRAVRFLLNDAEGGFDPRWFSGDWTECLTTDMLVHPNVPLELEDHLQPPQLLFIDENQFVSSDLFNVNAKVTNCELRLPASIGQNVRACDIVTDLGEATVRVSSALPRDFRSGIIGRSFCDENLSTFNPEEVSFPNDPSDISIVLERGKDPSASAPSGMKSSSDLVKAKSAFRMQVSIMELSTQIVPVIPFYLPSEPQQFFAPSEMKIAFCFEGEPPETEDSNLVKMVLYFSLIMDQIKMNCDLDLLAGAVSTILHHYHVVKETIECAKRVLQPILAPSAPPAPPFASDDELSASVSSANEISSTDLKIKKSLRGRRVLVHRQFHRSRECGGLKVAFFLQVADYTFTLWRQNVSLYSPIRLPNCTVDVVERQKLHFRLLKLLEMTTKNLEVGLEVDFKEEDRRTVLKCSIAEMKLSLCDFDARTPAGFEHAKAAAKLQHQDTDGEAAKNVSDMPRELEQPGEAIRNVLHKNETVTTPGVPPEAEGNKDKSIGVGKNEGPNTDTALFAREGVAYFKGPTEGDNGSGSCKSKQGARNQTPMIDIFNIGQCVDVPYQQYASPEGTEPREPSILIRCEESFGSHRSRACSAELGTGGIVNLNVDQIEVLILLILEALMMPTWSKVDVATKKPRRFPKRSVGGLFHAIMPGSARFPGFLRLFIKLIKLALPQDLRMLLFRTKIRETLVKIPQTQHGLHAADALNFRECHLMVRSAEVLTWYCSGEGQYHEDLLYVVAREGANWSSLVSGEKSGVNHKVSSRQSFHVVSLEEEISGESKPIRLVPEFELCCTYLQTKMALSLDNTLSFQDKDRLWDCLRFLKRFGVRCLAVRRHLRKRFLDLRKHELEDSAQDSPTSDSTREKDPIRAACADMQQSIKVAKDGLVLMTEIFDNNAREVAAALRSKDDDLNRLHRAIFRKEKERIAAVAVASSPVAGWLRMGGTHQSGHRIATTSTLWRYWAILRREILILYECPGQFKPVDLVFLRGAKLRYLQGARGKWDLKRAFGVVELGGKTRFFAVESDDEYSAWTREIERTSKYYQQHGTGIDEMVQQDLGIDSDSFLKTNEESNIDTRKFLSKNDTTREEDSVGAESTGALSFDTSGNSSMKGKLRGKLAGLGSALRRNKQDSLLADTESTAHEGGTVVSELPAEPSPLTEQFGIESGQVKTTFKDAIKQEGQAEKVNRRQQLRGKVSGVGQATSRWGSAILSATRQKGRGFTDKARRASGNSPIKDDTVQATSGELHVISEKESEPLWTCPKCTFINTLKDNDAPILVCSVCEIPIDPENVEFEFPQELTEETNDVNDSDKFDERSGVSGETEIRTSILEQDRRNDMKPPIVGDDLYLPEDGAVANASTSISESMLEDKEAMVHNNNQPGGEDVDRDILRRSQSLEATGLRDRLNSTDSSENLFRRAQSSGDLVGGGLIEPDETSSVVSDLALDDSERPGRRARDRFKGLSAALSVRRSGQPSQGDTERRGWLSRLGSNVSNSQEDAGAFHKSEGPLKLKNLRIDPSLDFVCDPSPPLANMTLNNILGEWFVTVTAAKLLAENENAEAEINLEAHKKVDDNISEKSLSTLDKSERRSRTWRMEVFKDIEFFIKVLRPGKAKNPEHPFGEVRKDASEILELHALISECVTDLVYHPFFHEGSLSRESDGDMSRGLINSLGLSPLDSVRLSGALLSGIADAIASSPSLEVPLSHQAEAVAEFLNSTLRCPLPPSGQAALKEFLNIPDAVSSEVWPMLSSVEQEMVPFSSSVRRDGMQPEASGPAKKDPTIAFMDLSSQCVADLLRAEQCSSHASDLLDAASASRATALSIVEPMVPTHVTEHLQGAMHAALLKVMSERDEAHAALVSTSVTHTHALEQERKKIERLQNQLERVQKQQKMVASGAMFGIDRRRRAELEQTEKELLERRALVMQQNSDAEIVALCEQMSGEISSRTQAALEVIRLKESRTIERQQEALEKAALQDELIRMKEMLAIEQLKAHEAQLDAEKWKKFYEMAIQK